MKYYRIFTFSGKYFAGIRLVHNKTEKSGIVEVSYNNEWKSVCDDYWTNDDANVACKQLGFLGYGQ